jgi:flagellar basal body-associated protein FliL
MLRRLGQSLLYVGPGAIILGAFAAGHLTIVPETDRLRTYRIENGLIPAEPEPVPEQPAPAADAKPGELDAEGRLITPAYRYFSFAMPFTGNIGDSPRLFSLEVSLSVFGSPFVRDATVLRLQEMETQLRPVVLEQTQGMTEDDMRDASQRAALALRIRDALNATFVTLGEEIEIDNAMITSFVVS